MRSPVLEHGPNDPQKKQPFLAVLGKDLVRFLNVIRGLLDSAIQLVGSASVTAQGASIATTTLVDTEETGLYRTTFSLRITQAATVSSSAQVTLGWTQASVSATQTFAAVTGNTTATQQSDSVTVLSDAGTPITYAVVYASVGATPMLYSFDAFVEGISE